VSVVALEVARGSAEEAVTRTARQFVSSAARKGVQSRVFMGL
jgi:hypothetical protein